jgi:hypothetical protein
MRKTNPSFKPIAVLLKIADGSVLRGKVNVGNRERLSDFFTQDDPDNIIPPFLILFEASQIDGNEERSEEEVYFINRRHIIWIKPEDEPF